MKLYAVQMITSGILFCGALCPRTEKTLLLRKPKEAQVTVNRENDRGRKQHFMQ